MTQLKLENLAVGYADQPVIKDLSLKVAAGEMVSILGPSGEGKTTVLKTIAGLLPPQAGHISINGRLVNRIAAEQRDVVLIFQKPLLFPFLNVYDNIGFGLRMQGTKGPAARDLILEMTELTGLAGLEQRKVHQLSGGQQQRVALARGLVLRPSILLLDEPLSNLDADLRRQMRELIQHVRRKTGVTTLFVTHDQGEALMLSDRVALLLHGKLRQIGTPHNLFYQPKDREVAAFFGCSNFLDGRIRNNRFFSGNHSIPVKAGDRQRCTAVMRPEKIKVTTTPSPESLVGKITAVSFEGALTRIEVALDRQTIITVLSDNDNHRAGETIALTIPPDALHLLPATE